MTTNTPDVGGTQIMQQPTLQVHGSSNNDNVFMVDNVQIQHIGFGGNQTGFYFNDGLMEEISYQTSSLPAEAPVGGVQINMIPRDGGNQFHGVDLRDRRQLRACRATTSTTNSRRSASGAEPGRERLRHQRSPSAARSQRDRLWFFSTFRRWSANNYLGNTFRLQRRRRRSTTSASPTRRSGSPGRRRRATSSPVHLRPQHQVARPPAEQLDHGQHQRADLVGRADHGLNYIGQVKWSSPMIEPAAGRGLGVHAAGQLQPVVPAGRGARCRSRRSTRFGRSSRGVSPRQDTNTARMFTYAGLRLLRHRRAQHQGRRAGAHRLVAGALRRRRGDIVQIVNNGVPNSVRLVNNPSGHKESGVNTGIYVQDSWRFGRVTINPGLRYERFVMSIPAQSAAPAPGLPRARLRGAGRHRQLEHVLAAVRRCRGTCSATAARR